MDLKIICIIFFSLCIVVIFRHVKKDDTEDVHIVHEQIIITCPCETNTTIFYTYNFNYSKTFRLIGSIFKSLFLSEYDNIKMYKKHTYTSIVEDNLTSNSVFDASKIQTIRRQVTETGDNIIKILIVWALFLCGYFFHQNKIQEKLKEKDELLLMCQRKRKQFEKLYDIYKNKDIESRKDLRNKIEEYTLKIKDLKAQNKALKKELACLNKISQEEYPVEIQKSVQALGLVLMKKDNILKRSFTANEEVMIYNLSDILYNGFHTRLLENFPQLSKQNIEVCTFIKFGFNNKQLSHLFNNKPDSVRKFKSRLKKQLNISDDTKVEDFIRLF